MKFLIAGGSGFIGCNYLYYVTQKYPNDYFVCIDDLTDMGNYNNIKALENKNNYKFIKGNITDRDFINNLFLIEKFDIVINFAAEVSVDDSIKNPSIFLKTNVIGTQILMDACRKYNIKRYHQVSTDEVYGDLPLDKFKSKFTEESPICPSNPYSASKASADLLVMSYYRTYGLPVTISRCSNNYGPHQSLVAFIPLVISNILKNKKIPVYGNGENIRDWINVVDHNIGIDLVIRKGRVGEIYNFGGHSEKNNLEVVKMILKYLDKTEDLIEFVEDRMGHDLRYSMDTTKAENELGWTPTYTFEEGLKATVKWYLNNVGWIENVLSGEYKSSYKE